MKSSWYKSFILLLLLACSRDKVDYIGPAYVSAPDGFSVGSFTATPSPVDFTLTNVSFDASFTNSVSWILTITGQKSGAVHVVKGTSNGFTGLLWKGNHDGIDFFRAGEIALATLSFYGTTYSISTSITITQVPNYTTCGTFPRYGDFEDGTRIKTPNWVKYTCDNMVHGVDSVAVDYTGNIVHAAQGKSYGFMRGLGGTPQFVCGIQYVGSFNPTPAVNPDDVWVNIYLYGTGDPNATVDVEYQEADFDGTTAGYSGTDDDAFVAHIDLNFKGWKLFSYRYSDLPASLNADQGGSGNKIHEPSRLKSFDIILLKKTDPNSPVEVYFDYPIITTGGPFKPCK